MLSIVVTSVLAFDCCAGSFRAEGHGGCYPPRQAGNAFDFVVYSSGMNFSQLAANGEDMGAVMLNGLGHWAWTDRTNCVKFPNSQRYPNYCFGPGSSFPYRMPDVTLSTGSTIARWKRGPTGTQIIYTTPPNSDKICHPVVEQGFKIPSVGGTDDDSVIYYNVQKATEFPQNAFVVPDFCPQ